VPTVPQEGHVCEFPFWSFSKQRSSETKLHIDYEDGSFLTIRAPEGMPSPGFPGYLDVILFYGQRDLFLQDGGPGVIAGKFTVVEVAKN